MMPASWKQLPEAKLLADLGSREAPAQQQPAFPPIKSPEPALHARGLLRGKGKAVGTALNMPSWDKQPQSCGCF